MIRHTMAWKHRRAHTPRVPRGSDSASTTKGTGEAAGPQTSPSRHGRSVAWSLVAGLCALLLLLFGCDDTGVRPFSTSAGEYNSQSVSGITFRWKVDGSKLRVRVTAPTRGWVAVGFAPSVRMQDANIIIGYVVGEQVFVSDEYGSGPTLHQPDVRAGGTEDVSDVSGKEVGGVTEIGFAIPLDSGDRRDRLLIPGRSYTVLLAYGPDGADEFTTLHAARARMCVTL